MSDQYGEREQYLKMKQGLKEPGIKKGISYIDYRKQFEEPLFEIINKKNKEIYIYKFLFGFTFGLLISSYLRY